MVTYGLPQNYYDTYPSKVRALTLQDINNAAKEADHPDNVVWVVVGDRSKIEQGVKDLKFGEVRFIDSDGNPVK